MKHNINFYFDEFKPKTELLTLSNLLVLVIFLSLLIVGFSIYSTYTRVQVEQNTNELSLQVKNQQATVKELEFALSTRKQDPKLTKVIATLQNKIQIRQKIIEQIDKVTNSQKKGYSRLMADLSSTIPAGIWLTQIKFDDNHIELIGQSQQAHLLPKWLQVLGESDYFQNKEFNNLKLLDLPTQNLIQFYIISSPQPEVIR
ncbi:PilN domain-containing protein [Catenovulum sp. 2E275]|uniref:PilN domain-containing protein n=1 Tax=Catenovulum sp. 2E275 TaxID=2980497 RepID=UPI0021CF699F|nr:PilN domain-containing protein [Catenovulum sp. 2E275]MCU4675054.1 PilN domain-containing protein [Catenovulum sp. 2E275]